MKSKKNLWNIVFLCILIAVTFIVIFKNNDIEAVWKAIKSADLLWVLPGIPCVLIFVCSESVIIYRLTRSLGRKIQFRNCVKYSFIGFFFSCITPSASGGQPAQLYYMRKDGQELSISTLVLLIVTIAYKAVLVIIGVLLLIFKNSFLNRVLDDLMALFITGVVLNVIAVSLLLVVVFWPVAAKKMISIVIRILSRIRIIKNEKAHMEKADASLAKYHKGADYFKTHPLIIVEALVITFIQRIALFFVTYLVSRAFHVRHFGIPEIVTLQAVISISVDMLPLPGGMGISETLFAVLFKGVFGSANLIAAMLVSRGLNYYFLMLISAVITLIAHFMVYRKESETKET